MSFFKKIFSGADEAAPQSAPVAEQTKPTGLKFGRYTDCNKSRDQIRQWNQTVEHFKSKSFVNSFEAFLLYLRDDKENNVQVKRSGDVVEFEIVQGSKAIKGMGDGKEFVAETNIALMDSPSLPVMRKLMSVNFSLRYSKFALKDNKLCMKFSSHSIDASPNKLYDALKELSRNADQQDDLLLSEFTSLKRIESDRLIQLTSEISEARYQYLLKLIADTKAEVAKLDQNTFSGGIAFLLLNLSYTIDYLIVPQGKLTDSLEKIQGMFFAHNNLSTQERNTQIIEEFDRIVSWPKEAVLAGIYDVKCTFAAARPETHRYVFDFFIKEREKVAWYRDNGYPKIVDAVYSYMITYAFFNMGMITPMNELLDLCMNTLNPEYYKSCGQKTEYVNGQGVPNQANLIAEINAIVKRSNLDYAHLTINTAALNYTGVSLFIDSLLMEMNTMNVQKAF